MSNRKYYVICEDNCKFEGMTKEQTISAIEQAVATGNISDVDAGFITKIKEQNKQLDLSFWVGTQAEYNALETKKDNCFYIINNSGNISELKESVEKIQKQVNLINTAFDNFNTEFDEFANNVNTEIEAQQTLINKFVNEHITIVEEYHGSKSHYFKFSNGLEIEFGYIYIFDGGSQINADFDVVLADQSGGSYEKKFIRFPFFKAQNIISLNANIYDYNTNNNTKTLQAVNVDVWNGKKARLYIEPNGGSSNTVSMFESASICIYYTAFGFSSSN